MRSIWGLVTGEIGRCWAETDIRRAIAKRLIATQLPSLVLDGMMLTMDSLDEIIADAKGWIAAQPEPLEGTATWYGFNNFRSFVASLEADASASNLEQTCHTLGWHISDQYGAYDELPTIAKFNERVRRIAQEMRRAE